jgi:hypothetical protein
MNFPIFNQSGCTVIDISNVQQPRYCFMFYPPQDHYPVMKKIIEEEKERNEHLSPETRRMYEEGEREEEEREKQRRPLRCKPLNAETYLTWPGLEKNKFEPWVDMGPWDLMALEALHDLWPQVPWPERDSSSPVGGQIRESSAPPCYRPTHAPSKETGSSSDVDLLRQCVRRDGETLDFS